MIRKDALLVLIKATELFIKDLSGCTEQIAKMQKRKTVQLTDLKNAYDNIDKFHFIKESQLPGLNPKKEEDR